MKAVSECRACWVSWYDNEEGDFRRSIYEKSVWFISAERKRDGDWWTDGENTRHVYRIGGSKKRTLQSRHSTTHIYLVYVCICMYSKYVTQKMRVSEINHKRESERKRNDNIGWDMMMRALLLRIEPPVIQEADTPISTPCRRQLYIYDLFFFCFFFFQFYFSLFLFAILSFYFRTRHANWT